VARTDDTAQTEAAMTVDVGKLIGQALEEKRTKPRVGMTVIYYVDGPSDGRVSSAKVIRVHDRDKIDIELRDGSRHAATWAGASRAPRPAGSWDFIV
jgi:hypothetical protein